MGLLRPRAHEADARLEAGLRLRAARRACDRAAVAARAAGFRSRDRAVLCRMRRARLRVGRSHRGQSRHAAGRARYVLPAAPYELPAAQLLPAVPGAGAADGSFDGARGSSRRQPAHGRRRVDAVAARRAAGSRGVPREPVAPRRAAPRCARREHRRHRAGLVERPLRGGVAPRPRLGRRRAFQRAVLLQPGLQHAIRAAAVDRRRAEPAAVPADSAGANSARAVPPATTPTTANITRSVTTRVERRECIHGFHRYDFGELGHGRSVRDVRPPAAPLRLRAELRHGVLPSPGDHAALGASFSRRSSAPWTSGASSSRHSRRPRRCAARSARSRTARRCSRSSRPRTSWRWRAARCRLR